MANDFSLLRLAALPAAMLTAMIVCRPKDRSKAKYELVTSLRTHLGAQDDAFGCMGVAEDADGKQGVFLRKNVIEVAGRALRTNITHLAPRILPWMELVKLLSIRAILNHNTYLAAAYLPYYYCLNHLEKLIEQPLICLAMLMF